MRNNSAAFASFQPVFFPKKTLLKRYGLVLVQTTNLQEYFADTCRTSCGISVFSFRIAVLCVLRTSYIDDLYTRTSLSNARAMHVRRVIKTLHHTFTGRIAEARSRGSHITDCALYQTDADGSKITGKRRGNSSGSRSSSSIVSIEDINYRRS